MASAAYTSPEQIAAEQREELQRTANIKAVLEVALLVCRMDSTATVGGLLGALVVIIGAAPNRVCLIDAVVAQLHDVRQLWQATESAAPKASVPS